MVGRHRSQRECLHFEQIDTASELVYSQTSQTQPITTPDADGSKMRSTGLSNLCIAGMLECPSDLDDVVSKVNLCPKTMMARPALYVTRSIMARLGTPTDSSGWVLCNYVACRMLEQIPNSQPDCPRTHHQTLKTNQAQPCLTCFKVLRHIIIGLP